MLVRSTLSLLSLLALAFTSLLAQDSAQRRFSVEGYGVANYYAFDWQTDPNRRNTLDLERLAIEPSFQVNPWLQFNAEIEFEHGGTGVTIEFDPFEEFGEFETEVEKGGEVEVEKLEAVFSLKPRLQSSGGPAVRPRGPAELARRAG